MEPDERNLPRWVRSIVGDPSGVLIVAVFAIISVIRIQAELGGGVSPPYTWALKLVGVVGVVAIEGLSVRKLLRSPTYRILADLLAGLISFALLFVNFPYP
jgi:hypothetical protein